MVDKITAVILVKDSTIVGKDKFLVGETYRVNFAQPKYDGIAQRIAFRMLKKEFPSTNGMEWSVKHVEVA